MTPSKSEVSVILLLLCVAVMPIIQLGLVNGAQFSSDARTNPPRPRPNPPGTINLPTARPTFNQPTARPTFSVSYSRSIATSFTFARSSWTGISITRTVVTSYTISPTFTWTTTNVASTQYWYPGMGFYHYGTGYSASTGSFTLGQTLYDRDNNPCLYYSYFTFNALAGLSITAQVWTTGDPVHYVIIPMSVITSYESPSSCGALGQRNPQYLSQIQTFGSTPYTLSWTAPQDDQYAIIFFSTTPYGNTVYFLPQ
jgi:hypothetical protein